MKENYSLGIEKTTKKVGKILLLFLTIFMTLIAFFLGIGIIGMIILKIFSYKEFSIYLTIGMFYLFIMTIATIYVCLTITNEIIIEDGKIIKVISKKKKEVLGNLTDITSFHKGYNHIYVMKNDKLLFKFPNHGIDNYDFINDLSNNYKEDIYLEGNITFISIIYWLIISHLLLVITEVPKFSIIVISIMTYLVYKFIIETRIKFRMTKDEITYRKIFKEEIIKISELNKVVETSERGYGRYKLIEPNHTIHIHRDKGKTISISGINRNGIKRINKIFRDNKIKVIKKNFK